MNRRFVRRITDYLMLKMKSGFVAVKKKEVERGIERNIFSRVSGLHMQRTNPSLDYSFS